MNCLVDIQNYKHISGIYIISNTVDNRVYVGSAINLFKRYNEHNYNLADNKHHSIHLQRFYNKYGENSLLFNIVITIKEPLLLVELEQFYIDKYKSYDRDCGFNVLRDASSLNRLGIKHRPEVIDIIREKNTGKISSVEKKNKISKANKGKIRSHEFCEFLKELKCNQSVETKKKIALSRLKYTNKVGKYSINGNLLKIYNNLVEASIDNKIKTAYIRRNCLGIIKYSSGYVWKFLGDMYE